MWQSWHSARKAVRPAARSPVCTGGNCVVTVAPGPCAVPGAGGMRTPYRYFLPLLLSLSVMAGQPPALSFGMWL